MNQEKRIHCGDIYLRTNDCQHNHFHYLPKKHILKGAFQLHSWTRHFLYHVLISLGNLLESLDIAFCVIERKSGLVEKKTPTIIFVVGFQQGEDLPNTISYYMLTSLIFIKLYGDLQLAFSGNFIKPNIACILGECLLCFNLPFGVL